MYGVLFAIGNILAVRAAQPPYGGCVAIAVGYAATPFLFLVLLVCVTAVGSPYPKQITSFV